MVIGVCSPTFGLVLCFGIVNEMIVIHLYIGNLVQDQNLQICLDA